MEKLRHETINCWSAHRDKSNVTIAFKNPQSAMKFMRWLNENGNVYIQSASKPTLKGG